MNRTQNYEALARKYRPKNFDTLVGQDSVSRSLCFALDKNRLSHAYLFSGIRGSGKTSSARIFAKALNCEKGPTSQPCEECVNCRSANEGRHIDIIEMDAASSRKIDDVRDLIEQTKYKPSIGRYKIFIVDEVHMLTKEAFNALLKTLEEPPSHVKFILATTDPLKLPATILSRTQHFRFKKINKNDVNHHLEFIINKENANRAENEDKITYSTEALEMLTRSGGGSLRDTLTLLDQAIIYSNGKLEASNIADMLGVIDPEFIKKIIDKILNKEREEIKKIINELSNYEAEIILDEIIIYLRDTLEEGSKIPLPLLDRFFRVLSEGKQLLSINCDEEFVLGLTFFKMIEATKIKDIDSMIEDLEGRVRREDFGKNIKNEIKIEPQIPHETQNSIQQPEAKRVDEGALLFEKLKEKIYDRSYELGKCFDENIEFESFNEGSLIWISKAEDECKERLKNGYQIINIMIKDIFGLNTKVTAKKGPTKEPTELKETPQETKEEEEKKNVEGLESEFGSCIAEQTIGESSKTKEEEIKELLEHPAIKSAKELFSPKKIIVQQKV